MRTVIGLGLALVTAAALAVSAIGAPVAASQKVVYHSKLKNRNNEILVVPGRRRRADAPHAASRL